MLDQLYRYVVIALSSITQKISFTKTAPLGHRLTVRKTASFPQGAPFFS